MSTESIGIQEDDIRELNQAAFNEGNLDVIDEGYTEDMVMHNVPLGVDYEGREAFKEWVKSFREAYPDFHVEIEDVVIGDEKVVTQYVATGTHEGPLPGLDIEPTNKTVTFQGVTVHRMVDGKATEAWWYYDQLGVLTQLGVIPEAPPELD